MIFLMENSNRGLHEPLELVSEFSKITDISKCTKNIWAIYTLCTHND